MWIDADTVGLYASTSTGYSGDHRNREQMPLRTRSSLQESYAIMFGDTPPRLRPMLRKARAMAADRLRANRTDMTQIHLEGVCLCVPL
jgi:hypothetical protein